MIFVWGIHLRALGSKERSGEMDGKRRSDVLIVPIFIRLNRYKKQRSRWSNYCLRTARILRFGEKSVGVLRRVGVSVRGS